MPRKIIAAMPLDQLEDEVLFTIASMEADPDANPLVPMTEGWLESIAAVRKVELMARKAIAATDARRMVANGRLDNACTSFGDDLYLACGKDTASTRWRQFFRAPVSRFVRTSLSKQVGAVLGWLSSSDAVLVKHKPTLETWSMKADAALKETAALAMTRGQVLSARDQLAEDLTAERDGVRDALAAVARTKGLPRTWPEVFFRTARPRGTTEPEAPFEPVGPSDPVPVDPA
jgi:hypothetical protein